MATNDTKIEAAMRNAMKHIDAIAAMEDVPVQERADAMGRVWMYVERRKTRMVLDAGDEAPVLLHLNAINDQFMFGELEANDATN